MSFGAYLDTRRRALGLSISETADWLNTSERGINRWITGSPPRDPEEIANDLQRLEDLLERLARGFVEQAMDVTASGPVRLVRFRTQEELDADLGPLLARLEPGLRLPLGAHAIMVGWAMDQLADEGIDVEIEWVS